MKTKNNFVHKRLDTINMDIFAAVFQAYENNPSTHIVIPNVCSVDNNTVSGFTKELHKRFPIVEANFGVSQRKLGTTNFIEAKINNKTKSKIIVADMCAQIKPFRSMRSLVYGSLVVCMYDIKRYILNLNKIYPDFSVDIHSPKFGTGVAGGNWIFISDLILDIWTDMKINVYNHITDRQYGN